MKPARILVIEDNPLNRRLLCDILEACGYETITAGEADTGLALARDQQPDLILIDISLPGMDGLTATRILKGAPATQGIPVGAVTAHAMSGDEAFARDAGCDAYISKPIDIPRFRETVAQLLERRGLLPESPDHD